MLKICLFIPVLLFFTTVSFSQEKEIKNQPLHFNGNIILTTKGLSTFPNLTLGKPAAILDLSIGGEKFRFDPTFRFGLDGKPWTFIFWLRFEAIKNEKFGLRFGAHPAYSFKTITITQDGLSKEILRTQQFLAGEVATTFSLSKNIRIGPYYIFSYGIDKESIKYSNFISFRVNLLNIHLSDKWYSNLMTQVYNLKMDDNDGYYINTTLSFNRSNFPFSISSTMNKVIDSTLPGDNFLWNINLTYRFSFYKKVKNKL